MARLNFPAHFVRKVRVADLQLRPTAEQMIIKAKWLDDLAEDIRKRGMQSPLLVWNNVRYREKERPMLVRTGQNRLRCLRKLGWTHAPCIIVGDLPDYAEDPVRILTLEQGQAYLADGILCNEGDVTLRINSTLLPEQGIHPKAIQEPYFNVD